MITAVLGKNGDGSSGDATHEVDGRADHYCSGFVGKIELA
jgi:hypothetical protein